MDDTNLDFKGMLPEIEESDLFKEPVYSAEVEAAWHSLNGMLQNGTLNYPPVTGINDPPTYLTVSGDPSLVFDDKMQYIFQAETLVRDSTEIMGISKECERKIKELITKELDGNT